MNVLLNEENRTIIELKLGSFYQQKCEINGEDFVHLYLEGEAVLLRQGEPELPYISRSIIVPNDAEMQAVIIGGEYIEYNINVIPSKGSLYRSQYPESIPYRFGQIYQEDRLYPGKLTSLSETFILRDFRGVTVTLYPFQYNPVTGLVRVYREMLVEVNVVGQSTINVLEKKRAVPAGEFVHIYRNLFINYEQERYPLLEDSGRKIVISHDDYLEAVQPYVNWKNQKGIPTELYAVSEIGTTPGEIRNFLRDEYFSPQGLTFVQLVGNSTQIPTFRVRDGAADPVYSLLDGDDNYPDIFVGRFSAYNTAQVETQVTRSITYERDINPGARWLGKAIGIASAEGNNPSDIEHQNTIRQILLNYGYNGVDRLYAPDASSAMVRDAVNEGRGLINYSGHGTGTSWSTTGFNQTAVDLLVNDNKLPLIVSVACQNGNFIVHTNSFAESWVRARNGETGYPTGGIAFYGSSTDQRWREPLIAQQEIAELLVNDTVGSVGGLLFNGSSRMIERWGNAGATEFKNWHIFGDVSLQVRTKEAQAMTIIRSERLLIGTTSYSVETNVPNALIAISFEGDLIASGYAGDDGNITLSNVDFPARPAVVTITITAKDYLTYIGSIEIIPNEGPHIVIDDYSVISENNAGIVEYGDRISFDFTLSNVGTETAYGIQATLCSDDDYITVLDSIRTYGVLEQSGIIQMNNVFSAAVADNIPDGHTAVMALLITEENGDSWRWRFGFQVNAPVLDAGLVLIDDSQYGNDNGVLDPGERVLLSIPVTNKGSADARMVNLSLISGASEVTVIGSASVDIDILRAGGTEYPSYSILADAGLPQGSIIPMGFTAAAGAYHIQETYRLAVGAIIEDFESGDFSTFPWTFAGNAPWTIDSLDAYRGNYSARAGNISHEQSTAMMLTYDVTEPSYISFYRQVSSEEDYDLLRFYINGYLHGSWSGDSGWGFFSFPVDEGQNVFKWEYSKDIALSYYQDTAWIDDIQLPTAGESFQGPIGFAYPALLDFGTVNIGSTKEMIFHLRNFGSEDMSGTIRIVEGFDIITDDGGLLTPDDDDGLSFNYRVLPQSNIPVKLSFMPSEERDYGGKVEITSNAVNLTEMTVRLNAAGGYLSIDDDDGIDLVTELLGNYPNPFNPSTTISYYLKNRGFVSIDIYNIRGQKVISLVNEEKSAGNHSVVWDGSNRQGAKVGSGVYFYRMLFEDRVGSTYKQTRKMLYLK